MISIVIPAHNEEKVIGDTIVEYVDAVSKGALELIVVCNGCADNTETVVRSFGPHIRCITTKTASKTHALNLGDAVASGFPRFYQDADVVLTFDAVQSVSSLLDSGFFSAAAPTFRMDFTGASWLVRAYYAVWQQLPYVREGMIGTGVYALSEKGRRRFGAFPEIIADDGYVRRLFQPHERTAVDTCFSRVRSPKNLDGLLKIKTRSRLGIYELEDKFPELKCNEEKKYSSALLLIIGKVSLWPKVPVYLLVNFLARIRAKRHFKHLGFKGWERDDSSRKARRV